MEKLLTLVVAVGFLGGCAPITDAEAVEQGLLHSFADPVVINPDDPYIVILPRGGATPLPSVTDPGVQPSDFCSCEWETWHTTSGLMCIGIVCSSACTLEYAACRERQACFTPPNARF